MIRFLGDLANWFAHHWSGDAGYLNRTWELVAVSAAAMAMAIVLALPMAAWLAHRGKGGLLAVSLVNIGRALPSFGIVALALPFTIRLARSGAIPFVESGLGFLPTFVALFALALPPIFTNTHAGIRAVDPEVVEAARGTGMSGYRVLTSVELPLAGPVILEGIRYTAVQVVATAPLGALVAFGGLGRYIVDGFAALDEVQIVAGAILVAVLAVATGRFVAWAGWRLLHPPLRPARRAGTLAPLPTVVAVGRDRVALRERTNREE